MTVASLVTLLGLCISTFGVVHHWPECLVIGLACDVLDGCVARYMGDETAIGARLDWYSDVLISHALLWSFGWPQASVLLVCWQAYARGEEIRFSGRAALSALAIGLWLWGLW